MMGQSNQWMKMRQVTGMLVKVFLLGERAAMRRSETGAERVRMRTVKLGMRVTKVVTQRVNATSMAMGTWIKFSLMTRTKLIMTMVMVILMRMISEQRMAKWRTMRPILRDLENTSHDVLAVL
ncbi:hypothetical protein PAXRUDRAFT_36479 [Paxillus rubicundulus Ve08.2h10]|uniref:Uncharacterized protein n=1 Tax=Paxillus rubicundulus Ve08.2h10 TaxID=930991 RepID=A0A0D0D6H3_9AGAM|nr:hypothetical protein PAXRUDRAFT_36479 [Paxillus rubicundulus Ve08.2h10]